MTAAHVLRKLCPCGKPAADGRLQCHACRGRRARESAEARGKCIACGLLPPTHGRKCLPCAHTHSQAVLRRIERLDAAGLCRVCGTLKAEPGKRRCLPCLERRRTG